MLPATFRNEPASNPDLLQMSTPTGYHLLTCVHWTTYLTRRHNALLRQLMILSSAAGVKVQNNNLTAFQQIEVGRTDLLSYGMGENATNLHTDVSIGHPCSRSHVDQTCRIPSHTLQKIKMIFIFLYFI